MKWLLIVVVCLVGVVVLMALIGLLLPKRHKTIVKAQFTTDAQTLWAAITDFAGWPSWNPQVQRMERLPDCGGQAVWLLTGRDGKMPLRVVELAPPTGERPGRLVSLVHPKYKTKYRVTNWPEYEQGLRKRGNVTLWFSEEAIKAWTPGSGASAAVNYATRRWPLKAR